MVTTSISTMTDLIAQYAAHMAAGGKARTTVSDRTDLLRRVDDDLPMGGAPYYSVTVGGYLDTAAGTDLTVAIA